MTEPLEGYRQNRQFINALVWRARGGGYNIIFSACCSNSNTRRLDRAEGRRAQCLLSLLLIILTGHAREEEGDCAAQATKGYKNVLRLREKFQLLIYNNLLSVVVR